MGYLAGFPGRCPDCGTGRETSGTYDAAFCPLCDEWQSPACRRWCPDCQDRPDRPSQAKDLDRAPSEIDPAYDLDTDDELELMRRVVLPVLRGTLPDGAVRDIKIKKEGSSLPEHWPPDVPLPDDLFCELTLDTGERLSIYLIQRGHVNPEDLGKTFAHRLEAEWCESARGWGEHVQAVFELPPPALA